MKPVRILISILIALAVLALPLWEFAKWTQMRVFVDSDHALVVINKFGAKLPPDRIVVPRGDNQYKGIREEVLGPGRYFFDPLEYDTELVPLITVSAGEPEKWSWNSDGQLKDPSLAPQVELISLKEGKTPPQGSVVAPPPGADGVPYKGVQETVLTPGTYKLNPYQMDVTPVPAVIVPPGSVGVVTRLTGEIGNVANATLTEIRASTTGPSTQPTALPQELTGPSRLVVGAMQRGILKDVLQPGIYYLNPRMVQVTIVPVGYDEITLDHNKGTGIGFYSKDGYQVQADFTVVWGRSPADAPHIVANIGTIDRVRDNVIEPAMKAACQNEGAKYSARELMQGTTRSQFQDDLSASLEKQVASRNIHVLLALIRNIAVKDNSGHDTTEGLIATIQRANIEVEKNLTNQQKTQTATIAAELQQTLKQIDVAKETVDSETNVKVANVMATGTKQAAEIDAQRDLNVAKIELQIATLDAKRTQILGKADADVLRLKNDATAQGAKMMVDALGSPQAYNQYIFAKGFEPSDLRLIFAGPGTFWTDLKTFQDVGATKMMEQSK
ncbi:MAG: hypothetical protein JO353_05430 [Phycisphaerae bacterium]|nr:hypothetical protein [Phycisphaerae bacterium]